MVPPGGLLAFRPPPGLTLAPPPGLTFKHQAPPPDREYDEQTSTNDDGERLSLGLCDSDSEVSDHGASAVGEVTLMVRNVPVMYTQEMLSQEWKESGEFNFLYLPRTGSGRFNLSYAFINFVTEADALKFKNLWQKKRLAHFSCKKPLNISLAEVQGLEANLEQFNKKRARAECQPTIITSV